MQKSKFFAISVWNTFHFQSLRIVQSKIQEIEQKTTKNPRDEAELAQLQTKQQQILSTGKPIEGPSSQSFSSQQNATQSSQQVLKCSILFFFNHFSFTFNKKSIINITLCSNLGSKYTAYFTSSRSTNGCYKICSSSSVSSQ